MAGGSTRWQHRAVNTAAEQPANTGGPVLYLNASEDLPAGQAVALTPSVPLPAGLYALTPVADVPPVVELLSEGMPTPAPTPAPGGGGAAPAAAAGQRPAEAPRR